MKNENFQNKIKNIIKHFFMGSIKYCNGSQLLSVVFAQ